MGSDLLRTSDIAKTLGVHVNTVRNYEKWGYLPEIPRGENGYRAFTAVHLEQVRLACLALQWPYLGERSSLVDLVKSAARSEFGPAMELAHSYLDQIRAAYANAEAAIEFAEQWAAAHSTDVPSQKLTISQTAQHLNLTVDMLRSWERNGLIEIPRNPLNQYRLYGPSEFERIRVIHLLLQSGFSLMAISRMLQQVDAGKSSELRQALELPQHERANEAIDVIGDHWLSSLLELERRAEAIIQQITRLNELVKSS
jgi:DNA-binding transcriptional MerR regulator